MLGDETVGLLEAVLRPITIVRQGAFRLLDRWPHVRGEARTLSLLGYRGAASHSLSLLQVSVRLELLSHSVRLMEVVGLLRLDGCVLALTDGLAPELGGNLLGRPGARINHPQGAETPLASRGVVVSAAVR